MISGSLFSQTYTMGSSATGTISGICSGTFYDSGGSGGSYGNSQNQTVTFCAPAGQYIYFDFTQFATESSYDYLYIYNGSNTSAPLIGQYTGSGLPNSGNNIYSTQGGCITFRFTSDGSVTGAGWTALIGCTATLPPPPPGSSCGAANAFCTGTTYNFPNNTNQPSLGGGGIYGCLGSTPNPVWYFLQIANPGNINITIQQFNNSGSGIDVDFIAWGPFTTLAQGCTSLSTTNDIDCSFSTSATEYLNIANAQTGQFYIVLLTNYSNQSGNITFSQSSGNGSTNCNVLCNMTNLTATPSACSPATNQYNVNGQITFQYPPTSGTLTVSSSCGGSTTIPAPWTSPINYSLNGLTPNGAACTITAAFSADPTCTLTTPYTSPAPCNTCTVTASNSGAVCPGGSVNLTSSLAGGTYSWTGPNGFTSSVQNPSNVVVPSTPGNYTYTVTVTQAGATCTASTTVVVNSIPSVNAGADQTICAGQSVTLNATGASSYSWDNGVTNGVSFSPVATTTYTVTGTGANGCVNTDQVIVNVTTLPIVNAGADQTICAGSQVTLSGSGATSYTWDNGVTNGTAFSPTVTTTYTVTGTIAGGCQNTDQVVVTVNPLPTVDAGSNQTICAGAQVTLTGSGASSYTWNNGVTNGTAFSPVATNTYTVTGTDANGCQNTDQVTVTVNTLPTINGGNDVSVCSGQAVTLTATGTAISFVWDNGISNGVSFVPTTTTTYTVTGTDANGCQNTDQVTVTVNALPSVSAGADQAVCPGQSITLSGSGATTYVWDNGVTNGVSFAPVANQIYTVTGTDANGCQNTDQVQITLNGIPTVSAGADQAICIGGAVTLSGFGADTYVWDNGVSNGVSFSPTTTTTYTVTGTTANGCQNTDQVVVTVNQLPIIGAGSDQTVCPGATVTLSGSGGTSYSWDNGVSNGVGFVVNTATTYTVTGTDANGCQNTDQVTVNIFNLPTVSAGIDQTVCAGAQVTLTGSGATSYTWDNGVTNGVAFSPATTTYTVTGTDANGCQNTDQVVVTVNALPTVSAGNDVTVCAGNSITLSGSGATSYTWDNGITNGTAFTPNATNTYTVIGTDANGCQNTDQVLVTVNLFPAISAGQDQTICIGTSVVLNGSGGVSYTWDNGVVDGVSFSPTTTTTYTVTGIDAYGCQNTDQVVVSVNTLPTIGAGNDVAICSGQSVTLTGIGGSTYVWDNGVANGVSFSPTATLTYTVTGTDANGCQNTDQVVVTVNALPTVSAGNDQTICIGNTVTLSGSGAVNYSWDNGVVNNTAFSPNTTNTYTVTGTDANGCQNTDQVVVTVNLLPVINAGIDQGVCPNTAVVLNGSGGVSYTWNNGITNAVSFTPATTTTYTVTGTDANGCQSTDQVLVTVYPLPTVGAGADQTICANQSIVLNGTGASSYSWDNGVTNGVPFSPQATTTYTVTGTSANGCVNTDQVVVTVNALPTVNGGQDVAVCPGQSVILQGSGANTYLWTNGITNAVNFYPTSSGTYMVTGTDVNGCQGTDQVDVTVYPLPPVNAGADIAVCMGQNVTLSATGAQSYTWDNGVTNGISFMPLSTTYYTVTGTSTNGCVNSDGILVTVNPNPTANVIPSATNGCSPLNVDFVVDNSNGVSYEWNFGTGGTMNGSSTESYTYTGVGCFDLTLTMTDVNGCSNTSYFPSMVCLIANPVASFTATPAEITIANPYSTMMNSSTGAIAYTWDFGDGSPLSFETSPYHEFPGDQVTSYQVMLAVVNDAGCVDTAYAIIKVKDDVIIYVPNSFTPDGDFYNQVFKPVMSEGVDPYAYSLFIFNRWGEIVFESHDYDYGWPGTYGVGGEIVQDGTYTWMIEYKSINSNLKEKLYGTVNLIR